MKTSTKSHIKSGLTLDYWILNTKINAFENEPTPGTKSGVFRYLFRKKFLQAFKFLFKVQSIVVGFLASFVACITSLILEGKVNPDDILILVSSSVTTASVASLLLGKLMSNKTIFNTKSCNNRNSLLFNQRYACNHYNTFSQTFQCKSR